MINSLFDNSMVPYLSETVQFAQMRHNILAGNVANLDTPGYKTRDLSVQSFQELLADAIQARHERQESLTSPLLGNGDLDPLSEVKPAMNSILRHDDANVGLEQQILEISKNNMMHNMAISIMNNQFQLLQTMISERV
jgi:flagellar basal-body rod protein FlgB